MKGAVYLLDKESGISSRKAAGVVAAAHGFRKYGHCGTLDPQATGLLIVLLGRATRLADLLSEGSKRYSFTLVTGVSTDTLDMTGKVLKTAESSMVSRQSVVEATGALTGQVRQKVPLYSAVRVNGKRGYRYARSGETPEMPVRTVDVSDWKTGEVIDGRVGLEVTVSSGTYVRALARDIGELIGVPCVADSIRRLSSGPFSVTDSSTSPDRPEALLPMARAVAEVLPLFTLDDLQVERAVHGLDVQCDAAEERAMVSSDGELIALGRPAGGLLHPYAVFAREDEI